MKIDPLNLPSTDQVFSWTPPEGGPMLHFAASAISRELAKHPPGIDSRLELIPVTREDAGMILTNRGIEPLRLLGLVSKLRGGQSCEPLLFARMADGSCLLIDGSHRYCAATILGRTELPAYILPELIWRNWLVDLPDDMPLPDHSGIDPSKG